VIRDRRYRSLRLLPVILSNMIWQRFRSTIKPTFSKSAVTANGRKQNLSKMAYTHGFMVAPTIRSLFSKSCDVFLKKASNTTLSFVEEL